MSLAENILIFFLMTVFHSLKNENRKTYSVYVSCASDRHQGITMSFINGPFTAEYYSLNCLRSFYKCWLFASPVNLLSKKMCSQILS